MFINIFNLFLCFSYKTCDTVSIYWLLAGAFLPNFTVLDLQNFIDEKLTNAFKKIYFPSGFTLEILVKWKTISRG